MKKKGCPTGTKMIKGKCVPKLHLYIRKLPKALGPYKYELYGGVSGGRFHSGIFKTKEDAEKIKKSWKKSYEMNPKAIQWRPGG